MIALKKRATLDMSTEVSLKPDSDGELMYRWCRDLFPLKRSITGQGFRDSLGYIQNILSKYCTFKIHSVRTGYQAFDWKVPKEWNISNGWIRKLSGEKVVDINDHNLHIVGYSIPINKVVSAEELQKHLHSLPSQPEAIPYVTSYYKEDWGFCLTHSQRQDLKDKCYEVCIDSKLEDGALNYGEVILQGESSEEIFLSTYLCHPSMANNELSGPAVTTRLIQWISGIHKRKYTYRFIFIPETIGSLVYLSKHLEHLKKNVIAGFNVTCIGDDRCYSYLPSRSGHTYSDRVAKHVLSHIAPSYKSYQWVDRGSDERQYCSPGVDLPVATIMRSKYGEYPEYHTSMDDLSLISTSGLEGGFRALRSSIECIEYNKIPIVTTVGEPQLGKRGLYPTTSVKRANGETVSECRVLLNILTYADGEKSLLDIAEKIDLPFWEVLTRSQLLANCGLLKWVE